MQLSARAGHFWLNDQPAFLIAGELQYFRIEPSLWCSSLALLKAAGFNAVSSYLPWIWHEPEPGRFDFTHQTHPQRNLVRFLEEVKRAGLAFFARPGPFIYAEYQGFGIPLWLGERHPECVMRRPNGALDRGPYWFTYTLHHPVYQQYVERWYRAVVPVLQPFVGDPVVAFQIDNETGILHANRLGEIDFNPVAVERFRAWLRQRYGDLEGLNRVWQCRYAQFEAIEPPRRPYCPAHAVDWQRFLEEELSLYLSWLHRLAEGLGMTVPIIHNEQGTHHSPTHICANCRQVDFQGYDLYVKASGGGHTADFPFGGSVYPSVFKAYTSETRPLWAMELGSGWLDPRSRVLDAAVLQSIVAAIAHGLAGYTIYPAQDGREVTGHEYQFQSLLNLQGAPTPRYDALKRLHAFLREHEASLLASEEIYSPIGYLNYYPNYRFLPEDYLFGQRLLDPIRYLAFMGHFGLYALMLTAGFNPRVLDLELASPETLQGVKLLAFPNKGMIAPEDYEALTRYVEAGGALWTFPVTPMRTLEGHPLDTSTLYPHPPRRTRWRHRWRALAGLGWRWLIQYHLMQRRALIAQHPTSQHILDLFEPLLVLMNQALPPTPVTLDGASVPAEHVVQTYQGGAVAYQQAVGRGTSRMLGTEPAGTYVLPQYYRLPAEHRQSLRRWIINRLHAQGLAPLWGSDLEAELVIRRAADGLWLFAVNRLGRQTGQALASPTLGPFSHVVTSYSAFGSTCRMAGPGKLALDLAPDDLLIARLR